ncbi:MAG: Gfo/Idh/MocA family oxidoreductase [Sedimentisphaerales bacterium]|nr:Gfo/Idh/MocA family oxidoreductase [Sedimentisphaerales bacterium]
MKTKRNERQSQGAPNRRQFLRRSAAATAAAAGLTAFPYVVPSAALGRAGTVAPSERITLAAIGNGPRCRHVMDHFMIFDDVRFLAVCDARQERREQAKAVIDAKYQNRDCTLYADIHEVLSREDIDAVLLATGDRMHAVGSILAAQAGKDVYSEKPMSLTIEEGRALVDTTKRYGTVYQCGHQRRSVDSYRFQVEVANNGLIGKVHTVIAQVWESPVVAPQEPQPVPAGFDYDAWLGPTPHHPYTPNRVNVWYAFWDTSGGVLIAMGCHYTDIAQWGLNQDDSGPVRYEGRASYAADSMADTPITCNVRCTYANGVNLILQQTGAFADRFIRFVGTDGWIQVDDETNVVTAEPKSILKTRGISARGWAQTGDHVRNFLDCIKTRRETVCPPEKSHRATTVCHVANIGLRLGRPVQWDPARERFVNDPEADRMLSRAMRPPWHL